MIDEAIILAGGFGTRLRTVVADIPKPMAPVKNRPFLEYILVYLKKYDIKKIILSTGFKHEIIYKYFGEKYQGLDIIYSFENEPLGTGGAIQQALLKSSDKDVLILNGDSLFKIDLRELINFHLEQSTFTLALKKVNEVSRFGHVEIDVNSHILRFCEKGEISGSGLINAGVYIFNKNMFEQLSLPVKFSIEKHFFQQFYKFLNFRGLVCEGYFVDIGVPDSYVRAQKELTMQSDCNI